ncbi:hypothetical protein [Persicobacter diffluens]|uniref:Uncharacterized protein n=1 Tax=Persicobacter diffluens TaxID=981 RepID=A0AAN5ALW8_9BACT|nr:hypothetical protein PEDI_23780 [Persicobacter diffluens]
MAQNIRDIQQKKYPDKKIVQWSAAIHNAKKLPLLKADSGTDYQHFVTMGQNLAEARIKHCHIAITTIKGESRYIGIGEATPFDLSLNLTHFEHKIKETCLMAAEGIGKFKLGVFGYQPHSSNNWKQHLDYVLFLPETKGVNAFPLPEQQ